MLTKNLPYPVTQSLKYLYSLVPRRIRQGKVFADTYNFLQESQRWDKDRIDSYQMQQLNKLLEHAYKNVPYYTRIFDERGLKPKDVHQIDDMKKLPFLTKEIIISHKRDLLSRAHKKNRLSPANTGGTSGSPLHFFYERHTTRQKELAYFWRMWNWHGFYCGDQSVMIGGHQKIGDKITYDPLNRMLVLRNPIMCSDRIQHYLYRLRSFKPHVIRGYPSLIFSLAHFLATHDIKPDLPSVKIIFLNSEKVFDFQRKLISSVFNCKVVDHYGHNEVVALFQKCELNMMYHVIPEYGITEFILEHGENESLDCVEHEIVGTGFNNYAFPMIRYRTEDYAMLGNQECSCLRRHVTVQDILGRAGDFILTKSKKLISATLIEFATTYVKNFKDFMIVQNELDKLVLLIVPDVNFSSQDSVVFTNEVARRIAEPMEIEVKLVDKIERTANNKKRFIHSDIARQALTIT